MFGIGFFELLVIAVVALIFVGPKKLPEVMRQAGKFFVHVRRTTNDVRSTFEQVVRDAEDEVRREETEQLKKLLAPSSTPPATVDTAMHDPYHGHSPHAGSHDPHHAPPQPSHHVEGSVPYSPAGQGAQPSVQADKASEPAAATSDPQQDGPAKPV